jgi:hypothetical protein
LRNAVEKAGREIAGREISGLEIIMQVMKEGPAEAGIQRRNGDQSVNASAAR